MRRGKISGPDQIPKPHRVPYLEIRCLSPNLPGALECRSCIRIRSSRIVFCLLLFIVSGCHKSDSPLKLYVFDCGTLKSGNPAPLIERGVTTTDMSVATYL